jgi:hypothetical protein
MRILFLETLRRWERERRRSYLKSVIYLHHTRADGGMNTVRISTTIDARVDVCASERSPEDDTMTSAGTR